MSARSFVVQANPTLIKKEKKKKKGPLLFRPHGSQHRGPCAAKTKNKCESALQHFTHCCFSSLRDSIIRMSEKARCLRIPKAIPEMKFEVMTSVTLPISAA